MKKLLPGILAVVMCISLASCGKSQKDTEAFEISKETYSAISQAYALTCEMADDIYDAWRIAIYEKDSVGFDYLSEQLNLSKEDLDEGIVYSILTLAKGSSYETASEEDKQSFRNSGDFFFDTFKDNPAWACITVTHYAYVANGMVSTIDVALNEAKDDIKKLEENFPDYEHNASLKTFYTTVSSYLELVKLPEVSYEQFTENMTNYEKEARDCMSGLDFTFKE